MTTTDEPALLAAILADPSDDTVRLVYADWLDENATTVECPVCRSPVGTPPHPECRRCRGAGRHPGPNAAWAEFIRVQIELHAVLDGFRPENIGCIDMYCDPDNRDRQSWKHKVLTLHGREREIAESGALEGAFPLPNGFFWTTADYPIKNEITHAVVSRGFVSHVTCTAAAFLGGECECVRLWELDRNPVMIPSGCYQCNGTGRVPGIAAELFRRHPIDLVTLTDKRPLQVDDSVGRGRPAFVWFSGPALSETSPHHLPDSLIFGCRAFYPDRDAALAALSAACVRYGRALAGLPAGSPAAG